METSHTGPDPRTHPRASEGATLRRYRANGLTVASSIPLPLMGPGTGTADATIGYGAVPERLPDVLATGPRSEMGRDELLLEIKGLARYWVREGRSVVVAPEPGAQEDDVVVFIMSSVMAALAHQNGFLPLHASAVEVDDGAVLFVGGPGAGKSTLAAGFYHRGHTLVADDICSISVDDKGHPRVHPGYRHVKLWAEALEHLGRELGEARPTRVHDDKYSVLLADRIAHRALPIRKIYALSTQRSGVVALEPVTGRPKIGLLHRETYRRKFIRGFGNPGRHFALAGAVANAVPMATVQRQHHLKGLDDLITRLVEDLAEAGP